MDETILLDAKTRADLGWDRLLEHLAARCHTARGATAALTLAPSEESDWIRRRLAEVDEAKALHDRAEPMLFGGASDIGGHLERAEKGGHLDGSALREVADTITTATRLRRHLTSRLLAAPRLAARGAGLVELPDVAGPIEDAFDDSGHLVDGASPALGGLRRKAAALHEELGRRARALLDHPLIQPHLQDHFYTQREERYVVPVRADARGRVKGIVHGTSGSGQTVFVEPEEIVDLNNRLKLAELEVLDEERRILGQLTLLVRDALAPLRRNLAVLCELDLLDAAARLSIDLAGRSPEIAEGEGARLDLRHARHPLMVLAGVRCVANDIVIARGHTLVISGPNAGGKTVALKAAGLLALMARAGLHLPVQEGSTVPLFLRLHTDVGDDQSLERNLSTFSAHIGHLNRFLAAASPSALLLLDEIAVGTDPDQGAALAQAVLEAFASRGATVIVTTHYDRLKALGARDPRFANASVGFDIERLEPTYQLHLGVPGASGAIVVARRLGLPEAITTRASSLAGGGPAGLEDLLRAVDSERRRLESAAVAAAAERVAATADRARAEQLLAEAKQRRDEARRALHDEAADALRSARVELEAVRQALRSANAEGLAAARQQIDRAASGIHAHALPPPGPVGRPVDPADLRAGSEVIVPRLGARGTLAAAPRDGHAVVQVGALKLTVEVADLRLPDRAASREPPRRAVAEVISPRAAPRTSGNTCDLRGQRVEEGCAFADKFIDDALRGGQDVVFFIHGHGTGALRAALRERLADSPGVASFRAGEPAEGGDGVTVATLA